MTDRIGLRIRLVVVIGHRAHHCVGRHRQVALAVLRHHAGDLFLVFLCIYLGADDRVHHLLRPLRLLRHGVLIHAHHAAGMVFPDVAGESQHPAAGLQLAKRVEWLGHDKGVDLFRRQRRRHIRRRHDHQIHLICRQRVFLVLDHRLESGLAQRNLQHDIVHRVPIGHRHLFAGEPPEVIGVNVLADDQCGTIDVCPRHDLDGKSVVVAHPHRNRLEEVHQVELARGEALDQR